MQNLSNSENTLLGCTTAVVVGLTLQPTLYWKNAAQQGKPFTANPRVLYRGTGAALGAEIGQMGLQFFITGYIKNLVMGGRDPNTRPMTALEEMSSALLGGSISAMYTSPVELSMIQQQNFGGSFPAAVKKVGIQGLPRGFMACATRDAIYTLGLLGILPVLQKKFQKDYGMSESLAGFYGGVIGGSLCGLVSAPCDAVKTCMQGDLHGTQYPTVRTTLGTLIREKRLFGGVMWRMVNITGTLVIANEFRIRVSPFMFPGKEVGRGGH